MWAILIFTPAFYLRKLKISSKDTSKKRKSIHKRFLDIL